MCDNHQGLRKSSRDYAKSVDIVIIAMIKSLGFVPKFDAVRTGWLAFDWTEITEPVTLPQFAGGQIYEDLRVSYHLAMAEEHSALLPLLWVNTRMQGGLKL